MRISESIIVQAEPEEIWELITDPHAQMRFMSGITKWEVRGDVERGIGARYRMLMAVGSAEIGGTIEVVEEIEARELAWTSVLGIDQRGRWRLREAGERTTRVELRFAYGVAGAGIAGWISEQVSAPAVRSHITESLRNLKRMIERERRQAEAA